MVIATRKQIFGNRLKQLREQNNLSLKELAALLSLKSKGSISAFQHGSSMPSIEVLVKIAEVFNVSPNYLLGFDGPIFSKTECSALPVIKENRQLKVKIVELEKQISKIYKTSEILLNLAKKDVNEIK